MDQNKVSELTTLKYSRKAINDDIKLKKKNNAYMHKKPPNLQFCNQNGNDHCYVTEAI